jgi:hypothetical protein
MRERDSREEDKEEGRGLGRGSFFGGKNSGRRSKEEILKERGRRRKLEDKDCFGELLQGHCCCWELWAWGPGNRKDSWS